MTAITKTIQRETAVLYRRRPLMIELNPRYLAIREKGRRDRVLIDYDAIYEMALKRRWQQEQAAKRRS